MIPETLRKQHESMDQLLDQAADRLLGLASSIPECIEYNRVAEHLREQKPLIDDLVKVFAKIDAIDPKILKQEPEHVERPKPRELSNEETKKYHELLARIASGYSCLYFNAEKMKTDGWERIPELLGYERQVFSMMMEAMDEIDAIDVALICPTNTKPLGAFNARSPDELIEHLKGEKGALAPVEG